jgi:hypothetical protein
MSLVDRNRWGRRAALALGLSGLFVLLAHPIASAASDLWGNVGPASELGSGALAGRYPLANYMLDQHFDAVSASLTGGVDASGVAPMIAYFLATVLWALTSFLANALIALFGFAFSLDLLNGSAASGGAGALAPVSAAIHSIYSGTFGAPWLVLAVAVAGVWALWKALVQRRYSETAGALALSLAYVVLALFFVAQPARTIGAASKWTNQMSVAFLSISAHGGASGATAAREDAASQLFELLVFKPWVVLEFGGLEHCAVPGSGSGDSDPESAPVRPLSSSPARDASLSRSLASATEISADGKVCVNNTNKYATHFLRFGPGSDERDAEYDALDSGDASKLPDADSARAGYRLGPVDQPATDAMEQGGQYQRLLIAIVVFCGELGAFCLLGSLSVGIVLAQVLLLLLLAFAPVALVAAAIPARGHAFFKGWLEKLVGYLLRKAAYSLVLAILLAVNGALASATDQLGWLMSFGLQALFFWAVFLQRETLTRSLVGIATGPGAPGQEGSLRLLELYAGARVGGRALGSIGRGAGSVARVPGRLLGGALRSRGSGGRSSGPGRPAPRFGTSYSLPLGGGVPSLDAPGPSERPRLAGDGAGEKQRGSGPNSDPRGRSGAAPPQVRPGEGLAVKGGTGAEGSSKAAGHPRPTAAASEEGSQARPDAKSARSGVGPVGKGGRRRKRPAPDISATPTEPAPHKRKTAPPSTPPRQPKPRPGADRGPVPQEPPSRSESTLGAELRGERERRQGAPQKPGIEPPAPKVAPRRRGRKGVGG